MTAPVLRTASCSCGQLAVDVQGEPVRVSVCHCLACQRRTGSVFGEQARFSRVGFEVRGRATEYARVGDEGTKVIFRFCPVCGSTVYFAAEGGESVAIPVGAFADPGFMAPSVSVYEDRKHRWVRMPDEMDHLP